MLPEFVHVRAKNFALTIKELKYEFEIIELEWFYRDSTNLRIWGDLDLSIRIQRFIPTTDNAQHWSIDGSVEGAPMVSSAGVESG